jgi:transposase InsO family protein
MRERGRGSDGERSHRAAERERACALLRSGWGGRTVIAEVFGVTVRTLWNWHRREETRSPLGRPPHGEARREEVSRLVRGELERQGWTAGRESVGAALGPHVPRRLVSEALRGLKAAHRAAVRRHRLEHRVSVTVLARDVVWAEDSTHLGRLADRKAILGEVVRDIGAHRTIGLAVGGTLDAEDVVAILEEVRRRRGTLPLVWQTDNAGPYVSGETAGYLDGREVVHLRSLPRTPQHNATSERGIGELKPEAELGKGVVLESVIEPADRLAEAWWRLDHERLRPSLGFRTAAEVDEALPPWQAFVDRRTFYEAVRRGLLEVEGREWRTERARRRARREVVLRTLERFGLVRITRGAPARTTGPPHDRRTSDERSTTQTDPEPRGSGGDGS